MDWRTYLYDARHRSTQQAYKLTNDPWPADVAQVVTRRAEEAPPVIDSVADARRTPRRTTSPGVVLAVVALLAGGLFLVTRSGGARRVAGLLGLVAAALLVVGIAWSPWSEPARAAETDGRAGLVDPYARAAEGASSDANATDESAPWVVEFGEIDADLLLTQSVPFRAPATSALRIRRIVTDCGCVEVTHQDDHVPAGEATTLRVALDPRGRKQNRIAVGFQVLTVDDDGREGRVTGKVVAAVRPGHELDPRVIHVAGGQPGDRAHPIDGTLRLRLPKRATEAAAPTITVVAPGGITCSHERDPSEDSATHEAYEVRFAGTVAASARTARSFRVGVRVEEEDGRSWSGATHVVLEQPGRVPTSPSALLVARPPADALRLATVGASDLRIARWRWEGDGAPIRAVHWDEGAYALTLDVQGAPAFGSLVIEHEDGTHARIETAFVDLAELGPVPETGSREPAAR